jgi:2-aminomuconate deaminase
MVDRTKNVVSHRAPEPVGAFPHAKRVGDLLFLSGIGPRVRGSKQIPGVTLDEHGEVLAYDIEAQCLSVFANVRTVLEDSGDMKNDFPIFNRLYAEHFADNQPTRTTIEINRLPTPIAIELKVIATID